MQCMKRKSCSKCPLSSRFSSGVRFLCLAFYRCGNKEFQVRPLALFILFCGTLACLRYHLGLYSSAVKGILLVGKRHHEVLRDITENSQRNRQQAAIYWKQVLTSPLMRHVFCVRALDLHLHRLRFDEPALKVLSDRQE
jgi:hypothetical protein